MSWLLLMLAAAGAVYYLVRARNQSRARFEEVLRREAEARERDGRGPGPGRRV
ncbi:hypothetical protein [Desulfocurvus sp.]|jgi:hypothetical protein|uniref:hypothetical protein n=1 Tax=Desulfocurvus sp. TaxID=2871698 RepID=UPI0025C21D3A|nr:hypothetical protein [Desulfocurvus sp.]MCK9241244.1 hypothetical protein [Desulfocurvus sp.]